jgi:hypothetical protein
MCRICASEKTWDQVKGARWLRNAEANEPSEVAEVEGVSKARFKFHRMTSVVQAMSDLSSS